MLNDITWREFQLLRFGYERQEKREWYRTREVAYASLIAGGMDPKKISKEKFMPLDGEGSARRLSENSRNALKKAQEKYLKEINGSRT